VADISTSALPPTSDGMFARGAGVLSVRIEVCEDLRTRLQGRRHGLVTHQVNRELDHVLEAGPRAFQDFDQVAEHLPRLRRDICLRDEGTVFGPRGLTRHGKQIGPETLTAWE
jgi:hypothetical protein